MDHGWVLRIIAAIVAGHTGPAERHLEKFAKVLQLTTHLYSTPTTRIAIFTNPPSLEASVAEFRFFSRDVGLVPPAIVPPFIPPVSTALLAVPGDGLESIELGGHRQDAP